MPISLPRCLVWLLLVAFHGSACAALGSDIDSVKTDHVFMKAAIPIQKATHPGYTVHEIQSPDRITVREYVSQNGKVFAVAWEGMHIPDLQQMLGTYFQQYVAAAQEARSAMKGRRPLDLQKPGLMVQTGGHSQSFWGRAIASDWAPLGVDLEQIR